MGGSAGQVKFQEADTKLRGVERFADVASSCDSGWDASDRDRLPLGVCMLIWLALSATMWGGIVGLGMLIFS